MTFNDMNTIKMLYVPNSLVSRAPLKSAWWLKRQRSTLLVTEIQDGNMSMGKISCSMACKHKMSLSIITLLSKHAR